MKLELLIKVPDFKAFEDGPDDELEDDYEERKAQREAQRIINGLPPEAEMGKEVTIKYTYRPYVLDMKDIGPFGMEDEEHTKIMMPFGVFYAKISYPVFSNIYTTMTGNMIKTMNDFKMVRR